MQFFMMVEMCRILAAGDDAVAVAGFLEVNFGVEFSNNVHLILKGKTWSIRSSVLALTSLKLAWDETLSQNKLGQYFCYCPAHRPLQCMQ